MPAGRLSAKQEAFLDWLCTPRGDTPWRTVQEWATAHGVSDSLTAKWKRTNKTFQAAMRLRFRELNTAPERIQEVVDALHRAAVTGHDSKAILGYLQFVGEFVPSEKRIVEKNPTSKLSNEELLAEIKFEADRLEAELIMEKSNG